MCKKWLLRAITAVEEVAIADLGLNQDCWKVIQRLYTTSHDLNITIIIIFIIISIVKILTEVMLIISGVCQERTKFCKDSRSPSCSALMRKQSRFSAAVWQGSTRWWWWCWWWWWWSRSPTSLQWSSKGQSGHPGTRFVGIMNAMDVIISCLSSSASRWK